jgi:hypothetical protein
MAPSPVDAAECTPNAPMSHECVCRLGHQGNRMLLRNRGHLVVAQHSKCKYQQAESVSEGN